MDDAAALIALHRTRLERTPHEMQNAVIADLAPLLHECEALMNFVKICSVPVLLGLPIEMRMLILSYCDARTLARLTRTCAGMSSCVRDAVPVIARKQHGLLSTLMPSGLTSPANSLK